MGGGDGAVLLPNPASIAGFFHYHLLPSSFCVLSPFITVREKHVRGSSGVGNLVVRSVFSSLLLS